jgi:hypothetical protein
MAKREQLKQGVRERKGMIGRLVTGGVIYTGRTTEKL